jgi:hypothetical protein
VTIPMETFWARYGRVTFEETSFAKALARLPAVKGDGPWIAGGSVRRLIANLPQESDFDFFFANEGQFNAFCADMEARGAKRRSENDYNVTFELAKSDDGPELKVQAIRLNYSVSLTGTIEQFDFSICKFGYDGADLHMGQWSLFDLASKRLVPDRISFGTSSLRRIIKYTKQGYTICAGGLASILQQVADDPRIIQSEVEYVD